jgi:hypothetical protein
MAYLRRGLISNRGAIPSTHTRAIRQLQSAQQSHHGLPMEYHAAHSDQDDSQPIINIRKVTKVIRNDTETNWLVVQLECGHTVFSRSPYQGNCKQCG